MARTTTSLKGLFAFLLAPAADALYAETGRRITTDGWGRIARTYAAGLLRAAAELVAPVPVPEVVPAPVPEPVADVAPESPVTPVTPEPVAPVAVPFGWASLDLPTVETAPEPAPVAVVVVAKVKRKPTRKPVDPPKVWTVAEVAARLDTQPRAVRKWIEAKRLNAKRDGKTWTVTDADLTAFLATLDTPTRTTKARG